MENLLKNIIEGVSGQDNLKIEKEEKDGRIFLTLKISDDYIGMIIGKEGKTIKAIRTLLKIRATLEKVRVDLDIQPLTEKG